MLPRKTKERLDLLRSLPQVKSVELIGRTFYVHNDTKGSNDLVMFMNSSRNIKHHIKRLTLPYGFYKLSDGSQVMFNRNYQPLKKRSAEGILEGIKPNVWVNEIVGNKYLYNDSNPPSLSIETLHRCLDALAEWEIEPYIYALA